MRPPDQFSLFGDDEPALAVDVPAAAIVGATSTTSAPSLKAQLGPRLMRLAQGQACWIGTSSWKYEGWLDQIYSSGRYNVRGRFSRKRFEQECLSEYAEVFPVVCGDFAFYQFPSADFWARLFAQTPAPFQFAFKVPEEITLPRFPKHPRYGAKAGQINPAFLSLALLEAEFLRPLRQRSAQVALLIFEFASSVTKSFERPEHFSELLGRFLSRLPKDFRYGVEVRDPRLLNATHFQMLSSCGVAHVFNSWSGMPPMSEQIGMAEAHTADFQVARALLKPGRPYEDAVRLFSPYTQVQEPNAEVRRALRDLLVQNKRRTQPLYLFVNNRLEGFAPGTITAVLDEFDAAESSQQADAENG